MAMEDWVGQEWRWWLIGMQNEARLVGHMSGDAVALPECDVKILMSPNHTDFLVGSSCLGRAGIGRSSW